MNRLKDQSSPYLKQHAHNPVDWYPWCDEAFEIAQKENKPVLVSIGYAACHWCHVMERESFEDEAIAAYMNEHFICIKVDREEHTDVDHLYMDALQAMTGQGGWPLNMFTTPERKPFFGGTYFPPKRIYQRASWMEILEAVNMSWTQKQADIQLQSEQIIQHLSQINLQEKGQDELPYSKQDFANIVKQLLSQADDNWGGFGLAPKFPQSMSLQFLLQYYYASEDKQALAHVTLSVDKMLAGGIYDQLAGGFARYSTDAEWLAPHFEKMLYDNALLLDLMADLYMQTQQENYASGIKETLQFCIEELSINGKGIGFYAAIDADSEGEEGKYYVWSFEELSQLLPQMDDDLKAYWDIAKEGNWEGKIILNKNNIAAEKLALLNNNQAFLSSLEEAKQTLLLARNKRERPLTDTKVLLSWNALLVSALVNCAKALHKEEWYTLAKENLDFLIKTFYQDGQWFRNYNGSQINIAASLEDLSYLMKAMLALGAAIADYSYILAAKKLLDYVNEHFSEESGIFYYFSNKNAKDIVLRKVETYDSALPSVNAVMAENNLLLSKWFADDTLQKRSQGMLQSMLAKIERYPSSFGYWAKVLLQFVKQKTLVISVSEKDKQATNTLLKYEYWPQLLIAIKPTSVPYPIPIIEEKPAALQETYYYCSQMTCYPPTKVGFEVFSKIKLEKMLE